MSSEIWKWECIKLYKSNNNILRKILGEACSKNKQNSFKL